MSFLKRSINVITLLGNWLGVRLVYILGETWIYRGTHGYGLEYAFNKVLKGVDGKALYQKAVGGNWKRVPESTMIPSIRGSDLVTTLDINLQDVAQSSLLAVLEKTNAQNGCVIVMEVATGAIKAIANLSCTESGKYIESYNYAIGNQGIIEPGSIFKFVSMLALLEETGWALIKTIDTNLLMLVSPWLFKKHLVQILKNLSTILKKEVCTSP